MNTNDLPPAAKLAALIEAGRAANPDLSLDGRVYFFESQKCGCALAFAVLGTGEIQRVNEDEIVIAAMRGARFLKMPQKLTDAVEMEAFYGKSLDEICASLREGELAKVAA